MSINKNKTKNNLVKIEKKLPKKFQPILWSKNIKNFDIYDDKVYIIHQILSYGSLDDIKILKKIYSLDEIKYVFVNSPKRIYTRKIFIFIKDYILKIVNLLDEKYYVKDKL